MDEQKRQELIRKRNEQQERGRIRRYVDEDVLPFLTVLDQMEESGTSYCLEYLAASLDSDTALFRSVVGEVLPGRYANLSGKILDTHTLPVQSAMETNFPSVRAIRYMPSDNYRILEDPAIAIRQAWEDLGLADQEVFTWSGSCPSVLRMALSAVAGFAALIPQEDLFVAPPDNSWLIFRSLEDEWCWLRSTA